MSFLLNIFLTETFVANMCVTCSVILLIHTSDVYTAACSHAANAENSWVVDFYHVQPRQRGDHQFYTDIDTLKSRALMPPIVMEICKSTACGSI